MLYNPLQKELFLKNLFDFNVDTISNIFNIHTKKAQLFYRKLFVCTFNDINQDKKLNQITSLLVKEDFNYKKFVSLTKKFDSRKLFYLSTFLSSLIKSTHNQINKNDFSFVQDYSVEYDKSIQKLCIKYKYKNLPISRQIPIINSSYDFVLNNTKERSIEHTNLTLLRYFYTLNLGSNHYSYNKYEELDKNGYKFECFASPIDRCLSYFCGLHSDIDNLSNGYLGNFMDLSPQDLIEKIPWDNSNMKFTFHPPHYLILNVEAFKKLYNLLYICKNNYNCSFEVQVIVPFLFKNYLLKIIEKFYQFCDLTFKFETSRLLNKRNNEEVYVTDILKIIIKSK